LIVTPTSFFSIYRHPGGFCLAAVPFALTLKVRHYIRYKADMAIVEGTAAELKMVRTEFG
jgi:hypothetical protein